MPDKEIKTLSARIPSDVHELAELVGNIEGTSLNALVVEGLKTVIENRRNDSAFQEKVNQRKKALERSKSLWLHSSPADLQ